ncbi:hypothetical protein Dda_2964 [Drechslerella dactyloides]|uniref:General transcription and DNA repair factor IIH n=1 Tax=Drechslerella dactyloides TaxID=74499 RepID=A0AAD6J214_DREDA|nr:hypothetical protein Dda_2964 [Drechslerella dactyloides]
MADSDEDFVLESSGDERGARGRGSRRQTRQSKKKAATGAPRREKWEDIQRSWDTVVEAADGSIAGAVIGLLEATKRKRLLRDTTPIQRGIIRHLVLVLDLSSAMNEKDLRPTRFHLTLRYARDFVTEYFEQNPISQLSIVGMHDGLALRISDMGGNPADHLSALQDKAFTQEPKGASSLQNALEMARAELFHTPSHGTREVLLIFGALSSSDPGDIHDTIKSLVEDRIQVRIVGLAAQVAVCRELVMKTNKGDDSGYGVVLDEAHYRELMMTATTPPVTKSQSTSTPSLLMMGFPSRTVETHETLCTCAPSGPNAGSSVGQQQDQTPAAAPISQRYACPNCRSHFCIDCDIFAHESLHNCPGCQAISASTIKELVSRSKDAKGEPVGTSMRTQVAEATRMLEKSKIAPGSSTTTSMEIDP